MAAAAVTARSAEITTVFPGVRLLIVDNRHGELRIRAGGPDVILHRYTEWTLDEPWIQEEQPGTKLTIRTRCSRPDRDVQIIINCEVSYDIEVPPEIALDLYASDEVSVTGTHGDLTIRPDP
ncbi:hypothetical protein [Catenuloplanes japonicus]|uniref:hypothetical protein n=1 Tax=Catenuloplanes japonicus TaxID=33876 RepID=UPI0005265DCC|nr:hypothetical protein [Catenuloplanes japonicus]